MRKLLFMIVMLGGCAADGVDLGGQSEALGEENMCKPLGAHCFDEEENPNPPGCCDPETAGCFRGECTEKTVNPPGCVPIGDPCTPGVSTCCSGGAFDPLGVCEDPFGEGFVCVPPA